MRTWPFAILIIVLTACHPLPSARAATPYEAQLGGRIIDILFTLIIGEFGGRTSANTDGRLDKRTCRPSDYDALKEAVKDNASLIAFHSRCRMVEWSGDSDYIYNTAYLPPGYCENLKLAFENMLAVHVYPKPRTSKDWLIFEYKGLRLEMGAGDRELIRKAQLNISCRDDGALRVSAPRTQRPI